MPSLVELKNILKCLNPKGDEKAMYNEVLQAIGKKYFCKFVGVSTFYRKNEVNYFYWSKETFQSDYVQIHLDKIWPKNFQELIAKLPLVAEDTILQNSTFKSVLYANDIYMFFMDTKDSFEQLKLEDIQDFLGGISIVLQQKYQQMDIFLPQNEDTSSTTETKPHSATSYLEVVNYDEINMEEFLGLVVQAETKKYIKQRLYEILPDNPTCTMEEFCQKVGSNRRKFWSRLKETDMKWAAIRKECLRDLLLEG